MKYALALAVVFCAATVVNAGAVVDLVLTPDLPAYDPGTSVQVDVYFGQDTAGEDILLRGIRYDFSNTDAELMGWIGAFGFDLPFDGALYAAFPAYPRPSAVFNSPSENPLFQEPLPGAPGMELNASFMIDIPMDAPEGVCWTLDLMSPPADFDPNLGARLNFGFGGAGDPITDWYAYDGTIVGGVAEICTTPEPASLALLALGGLAVIRRR
jgi:hypothetical protein